MVVNPVDNTGINWEVGDTVDSVGGMLKGGKVIGVRKEGNMTILKIRWPDGREEERSDRIVKKVSEDG